MNRVRKNLISINRDLKVLSKKLELLIETMDEEKAAPIPKKTAAKTAVKQGPQKKGASAASKKTAPGKLEQKPASASDVLELIRKAKRGIDLHTIILKTGLDAKLVQNIISRNYKQGKIISLVKGVYTMATKS